MQMVRVLSTSCKCDIEPAVVEGTLLPVEVTLPALVDEEEDAGPSQEV